MNENNEPSPVLRQPAAAVGDPPERDSFLQLFRSSLLRRLSTVLILLLAAVSWIQFTVLESLWDRFIQTAQFEESWAIADHIAAKLQPQLAQGLDYGAVERVFGDMALFNPAIDCYLVATDGNLIAALDRPLNLRVRTISTAPIEAYLDPARSGEMILGDDPTRLNRKLAFSAAHLSIGGTPAYVYAVMNSSSRQWNRGLFQISNLPQMLGATSLAAAPLAAIIGIAAFVLLTNRLRRMAQVMEALRAGDLSARLNDRRNDEIGRIARVFDRMADTIDSNVNELRRKDDQRRELVANISHDLRGPVAALRVSFETLRDKLFMLSAEERTRFLDSGVHNLDGLATLISQLFELSRLETGGVSAQPERIPLAELAEGTVSRCLPSAHQRGVRLSLALPADPVFVTADGSMLERVFANLVQNAIQYTASGGEVQVRVVATADQAAADQVTVEVADTGIGMSQEEVERIFERSYRTEAAKRERSEGAGLGLAIVRALLALNGTTLEVESEIGKGTVFRFALPRNA